MLRNLLAGALALALSNSGAAQPTLPPNSTPISSGIPPVRYQGDNGVIVLFVDDVSQICGKAPAGYVIMACQFTKDGAPFMVLPNPCKVAAFDPYARIACHELGHRNGWPILHGD